MERPPISLPSSRPSPFGSLGNSTRASHVTVASVSGATQIRFLEAESFVGAMVYGDIDGSAGGRCEGTMSKSTAKNRMAPSTSSRSREGTTRRIYRPRTTRWMGWSKEYQMRALRKLLMAMIKRHVDHEKLYSLLFTRTTTSNSHQEDSSKSNVLLSSAAS